MLSVAHRSEERFAARIALRTWLAVGVVLARPASAGEAPEKAITAAPSAAVVARRVLTANKITGP